MGGIQNLQLQLSRLTEGLANLSMRHVLLAVGVMLVLLIFFRLTARRRDQRAHWAIENLQVILSVVVVVFLIIRPFLFQAFYIPSSSMEPTLMGPDPGGTSGDRLLVNKLIYRVSDPHRFDIAVFKAPPQASPDEKEFIKRVIGEPGDSIEVIPPRLQVDGKTLLKLAPDEGSVRVQMAEQEPRDSIRGNVANLKVGYNDSTFKVIADPGAEVTVTPTAVTVDGKVELEDPNAQIREIEGLASYGADPSIRLRVFATGPGSFDIEPRLAVVKGEKLVYDPGHVVVTTASGQKLRPDEPYIAEDPHYSFGPKKLAAHEYFMMGDNRNNSNDSHMWGPLTRERFIGRAEIIFWPLNRARVIHWWLISVLAGLFIAWNVVQRLTGQR